MKYHDVSLMGKWSLWKLNMGSWNIYMKLDSVAKWIMMGITVMNIIKQIHDQQSTREASCL